VNDEWWDAEKECDSGQSKKIMKSFVQFEQQRDKSNTSALSSTVTTKRKHEGDEQAVCTDVIVIEECAEMQGLQNVCVAHTISFHSSNAKEGGKASKSIPQTFRENKHHVGGSSGGGSHSCDGGGDNCHTTVIEPFQKAVVQQGSGSGDGGSGGNCLSQQKGKYNRDPRFGEGPRVALCIGIDNYSDGQLPNCVNDARDMHSCLELKLGFEKVFPFTNTDRRSMVQGVRDLRKGHIKDGSLVVFFFSGHGVEYAGVNYLLPLHMQSKDEEDYEHDALSVDWIVKELSGFSAVVNVLLLDCCRENEKNNTFKMAKGTGGGSKGMGSNFRSTARNAEYLIGLACDPGTVALANDKSTNSRYTAALLEHLPVPGRPLEDSMKEVTRHVLKNTQKQQRPWSHSCLIQDVVLVPISND